MKPTIPNRFERWNAGVRAAEASLVNLLSAIAPWGAPLAPAYMSYGGMVERLEFAPWVALALAGVIEILGLSTVHTTLQFWRYNRRNRAGYKRQPAGLAASMFGFYLAVILVVNVLLEWPAQSTYIPLLARALLTLLSIPAGATLAMRAMYAEALSESAGGKVAGKLPESKPETSGKLPERIDFRNLPEEDRKRIAGMPTTVITQRYGVSDRTARNWKNNTNGKMRGD